jgi:hypothetical protein
VKNLLQQKKASFAGRDAPLGLSSHRDDADIVSKSSKKVKSEQAHGKTRAKNGKIGSENE